MEIFLQNRQRAVRIDLRWLQRFAAAALTECAAHSADGRFALRDLAEIEVAIVSDRVTARVHAQFMGIPGPTDVITFAHGEIVMSAQTALAHATARGHAVELELALYTVHGLLHLNGYDDAASRGAARMRKTQDRVMMACLAQILPR